jgi:hypothetical protein
MSASQNKQKNWLTTHLILGKDSRIMILILALKTCFFYKIVPKFVDLLMLFILQVAK